MYEVRILEPKRSRAPCCLRVVTGVESRQLYSISLRELGINLANYLGISGTGLPLINWSVSHCEGRNLSMKSLYTMLLHENYGSHGKLDRFWTKTGTLRSFVVIHPAHLEEIAFESWTTMIINRIFPTG